MTENYIQYAGGYQKDNISKADIEKAFKDIQLMDDEHGAFWVSVITVDENVIEVNKDLSLSAIFQGDEIKYQANDWNEVNELYSLLLKKEFHEVKQRIMKTQHDIQQIRRSVVNEGFLLFITTIKLLAYIQRTVRSKQLSLLFLFFVNLYIDFFVYL